MLIPGEVAITGEIVKCEKLIVEGEFRGTAMSARGLLVGERGVFQGEAAVDEAEIIGFFDGALTVREKLLIRAGGRVKGTVRYGRLSIENGGVLSGDTQPLDENGKT
ncbi:bactofilin family protein [Varunaivibrio sulfuroxidans]|uniref:bactofilin family protein n=1 Tax=Varunaivibrio sulfuroxidans TaxID=1773489 RepID=UPI0023E18696|nr:polymer-forming cytoskeletal protein [Varunaivibrio sulfuroxidans]WES29789.1 polymer-forming cytoskeletal protein [Varunaivibrio sulfuroxidans]